MHVSCFTGNKKSFDINLRKGHFQQNYPISMYEELLHNGIIHLQNGLDQIHYALSSVGAIEWPSIC